MNRYFKTYNEVLKRPGNLLEYFINEKEERFQHPFTFGLMGVIVIIIINSVSVDFNINASMLHIESESEQIRQLTYWIEWVRIKAASQYLPLSMFVLLIPSLSIPGIFFFREDLEGFYSNLILNSYSVGASIILLLLLIPVWMVNSLPVHNPGIEYYLPGLIIAGVILWIYHKKFMIDDFRGWIRILSSYILGYGLFLVLKSFTASVIGYFIFAVNRFIDIWVQL